jgi:hypothetical protein
VVSGWTAYPGPQHELSSLLRQTPHRWPLERRPHLRGLRRPRLNPWRFTKEERSCITRSAGALRDEQCRGLSMRAAMAARATATIALTWQGHIAGVIRVQALAHGQPHFHAPDQNGSRVGTEGRDQAACKASTWQHLNDDSCPLFAGCWVMAAVAASSPIVASRMVPWSPSRCKHIQLGVGPQQQGPNTCCCHVWAHTPYLGTCRGAAGHSHARGDMG